MAKNNLGSLTNLNSIRKTVREEGLSGKGNQKKVIGLKSGLSDYITNAEYITKLSSNQHTNLQNSQYCG